MRCSPNEFDWNANTIARLRSLWAEGHSTAEIGRRMGVSKNAVVGKSHRLNLPARPSPIRSDRARTPRVPRRPRCPPLPALRRQERPALVLQSRPLNTNTPSPVAVVPVQGREVLPALVPPAPTVAAAMPVSAAIRGTRPCCWPIGEPGTRSFRFCDAPNEAGKPYCPDHCGIAYRKKEPSRKTA